MIPVIAIVGRPNVGKSTLFNQLTRSREALVVDLPGVTRDRQYGEGRMGEQPFIVIDTGGLGGKESVQYKKDKHKNENLSEKTSKNKTEDTKKNKNDNQTVDLLMEQQSWQAVQEADVVLFLVDARSGLTPLDEKIAHALRIKQKKLQLVVNKTDGLNADVAMADFYALGLGEPAPIAASHGRGVLQLIEKVLAPFTTVEDTVEKSEEEIKEESEEAFKKTGIKIAIVGRPNVGKSTLVNRMLGEERVVVFDEPGTTRDSIYIPLERLGTLYTIIDTAGVRRRARVKEVVEKFSVVKTLQAIEDCHVVIQVLDAREGITEQDLSLLDFVIDSGRALVIAINKWDGMEPEQREQVKQSLNYRLHFADFAKIHFISALHGTGVGNLFDSVHKAYQSSIKELSTAKLTRILAKAVTEHTPPMVRGRRIKLRYAHTGGHQPPLIVIHGNQTEHLSESYKRYLIHFFRKHLNLQGTPIRLEFKTSENPYAGRRNTLTPRQAHKRKRLMKFSKKKKK